VTLLVDEPNFVHNTYLQLFAEGGIVALALFLAVVLSCLGAARRAAELFARSRARALEILARAVLVAMIGMLAAGMFLSAALDPRLWVLLALGPALLGVASSRVPPAMGEVAQDEPYAAAAEAPRPKLVGA
jgi:O-antigen ligase